MQLTDWHDMRYPVQLPSLFKRANRSQIRSHPSHPSHPSYPPSYPHGKRIALPVDAPFLHVRFPSLGTSVHLHQRTTWNFWNPHRNTTFQLQSTCNQGASWLSFLLWAGWWLPKSLTFHPECEGFKLTKPLQTVQAQTEAAYFRGIWIFDP